MYPNIIKWIPASLNPVYVLLLLVPCPPAILHMGSLTTHMPVDSQTVCGQGLVRHGLETPVSLHSGCQAKSALDKCVRVRPEQASQWHAVASRSIFEKKQGQKALVHHWIPANRWLQETGGTQHQQLTCDHANISQIFNSQQLTSASAASAASSTSAQSVLIMLERRCHMSDSLLHLMQQPCTGMWHQHA